MQNDKKQELLHEFLANNIKACFLQNRLREKAVLLNQQISSANSVPL